jgi:hypothetical protein
MLDRIMGVFKLDPATFESIEHDESATSQAGMIVLAVAVLGGLGSLAAASFMEGTGASGGFFSSIISTFASWVVWSFLTYFIGTRLFGGEANMGEMLRVIGFAYAPQLLGIVPCLGSIVGLIWSLAAAFIGIRQGLDLSNGKTALTIVVGLVVYVGIALVMSMLFGGLGSVGNPLEGFTA